MAGVLLNLIVGLSRVLLAMGRRGDAPAMFGELRGGEPFAAIIGMAVVVGGLCLFGDVRIVWTFSAVTALVYYAITNAAALRLQGEERPFPRWIAWIGIARCVGLAALYRRCSGSGSCSLSQAHSQSGSWYVKATLIESFEAPPRSVCNRDQRQHYRHLYQHADDCCQSGAATQSKKTDRHRYGELEDI